MFVIGKKEHLVFRDFKKFENVIAHFDLISNNNKANDRAELYYICEKTLKPLMNDKSFLKIWKKSIVIVDE